MPGPDFDSWIASTNVRDTSSSAKAVEAWNRIQDNPTSITVYRDGVPVTAQTVRIEFQPIVNERQGNMSEASHRNIWFFGVKDHPSVTDTNLQNGDEIRLSGHTYQVRDVIVLPGEIQADGVRIS